LKQTPKDRIFFTQLARYNKMHKRVMMYQKTIPEKLASKQNLSIHKVDI